MKTEAEIVDNLLMNSNPNTHFFSNTKAIRLSESKKLNFQYIDL